MKARTVQQLFNAVIAEGFYSADYRRFDDPFPPSEWMCCAVTSAVKAKCITEAEAGKLARAINQYLYSMYNAAGTLATALRRNDLPADFNARLTIYRDWDNRPRKVK
jgi:hypothetical protein